MPPHPSSTLFPYTTLFRSSFFMVLEFVRGVTLDHVIQQRGALPSEQAIPLFCQVLDGIQHAHDFGIIHRDIKPDLSSSRLQSSHVSISYAVFCLKKKKM